MSAFREIDDPFQLLGHTTILVAGGHARSGKGTSMGCLYSHIQERGRTVNLIDQGIKFRSMAKAAIASGEDLTSPAALNSFISSTSGQKSILAVLAEVDTMDTFAKRSYLYAPVISNAAGLIGGVEASHEVAVDLLREQVVEAVENNTEVLLIDGRSMKTHVQRFEAEGLARFSVEWFFTCDPAIAARRSLGLFAEYDDLSAGERQELLAETLNISGRNRRDSQRTVDPMREPRRALHIDLQTYKQTGTDVPYKQARDGMGRGFVVDTSYTSSAEEMTGPVTELSMLALLFKNAVSHADCGIKTVESV